MNHDPTPAPPDPARGPLPEGPEPALEALEVALRAEPLMTPPEDLVARVLAGLPARQPRPVLHALARLAAAVLVALGAWVMAFGSAPGSAEAGLAEIGPAPAVREALGPALDLVPTAQLELPALPLEASGTPSILGLALAGLAVLVVGLYFARRMNTEDSS